MHEKDTKTKGFDEPQDPKEVELEEFGDPESDDMWPGGEVNIVHNGDRYNVCIAGKGWHNGRFNGHGRIKFDRTLCVINSPKELSFRPHGITFTMDAPIDWNEGFVRVITMKVRSKK